MENIKEKINYCLNCITKPCVKKGCPLENDIPSFIQYLKEDNIKEAYKVLSKTTVLPGLCGRICPHLKQCQGACTRGIKGESVSIGELEAYVFDKAMDMGYSLSDIWKEEMQDNKNNVKIAVVGGGPSGLTSAAFLAKFGFKVTIYEKHDYLGGLLVHGIPEFRLEKNKVEQTVENILNLGIEVKYNQELGKNISLQELEVMYDYIVLCIGANCANKMEVDGEDLKGVYGGNELLEYKLHPRYNGKKVMVFGGGNVAIDCARTAKKMGAESVKIIYRRSAKEMPAEIKEIEDAINEGVEIIYQTNLVKIIGKDNVEKVELIKTNLIQKEGERRLTPVNIDGSNYSEEVDIVIMALGAHSDSVVNKLGVELNKWNNINIDEKYKTSRCKIYAVGDVVGVKSTVAWAAKSGREVAKKIKEDIKI